MSCVITNIYNKKTKGPTLMELFTATRKLKKVFDNWRCSMCAPRVTRHTSIRYSSFMPHTRQHGCSLLAQTPSFSKLFISRMNGLVCRWFLCVLCTKCTLQVTTDLLMWYSNTQNDFSPAAAIFSLHTHKSPSGRNVNYDEKQLTGGKKLCLSCSFYLYRFRK